MIVFKLLYHITAFISQIMIKLIYRSKIKIGKHVTWRKSLCVMIDNNGFLSIGNNCFFNNYCSLNANKKIVIGRNCIFGENVKIYDHNHRFSDKEKLIKEQGFSNGEVVIGDNCWIGSNVVILRNTTIGNNCVIAAGCTIKGDIPDNTIVKNSTNWYCEDII